MSEKLTRIRLRNVREADAAFMDWGEQSKEHMIKIMRERARHMHYIAELIDATDDHEFEIDLIRGTVIQKLIRKIQ